MIMSTNVEMNKSETSENHGKFITATVHLMHILLWNERLPVCPIYFVDGLNSIYKIHKAAFNEMSF